MVYTLIIGKKSYDLPKKTISIVEQMDDIANIDANQSLSTREKYAAILDFVISLVGEDSAEAIFGSTSIDNVDLSEVLLAFRKIVDSYNRPVQEYEQKHRAEQLSSINQLPLDKLAQAANLIDKVQTDA